MMEAKGAIDLVQLLEHEGIDVWLVGGWGVEALLGEQTRPHEDVDIVIEEKNVPKLRKLLEAKGFKDVERDDTSAWNFVLGDSKSHKIDVHAIVFDESGNGIYGPVERGVMFPAASLTGIGNVNGHTVKCISAEYLVKFISPWLYKLRDKDFKAVSALCERFGIDYPKEYVEKLQIREGNIGDLDKLVLLANKADEARLEPFADVAPRGEGGFRKVLKVGESDFWVRVATLNSKIVGFISGEPTINLDTKERIEGVEHIKTLIVDPQLWGKKIGGSLVTKAIEVAKKRGRKQIELWTHETNSRAQRLYEGKGFKLTGEKKKAENTDEWIVHYSLDI